MSKDLGGAGIKLEDMRSLKRQSFGCCLMIEESWRIACYLISEDLG